MHFFKGEDVLWLPIHSCFGSLAYSIHIIFFAVRFLIDYQFLLTPCVHFFFYPLNYLFITCSMRSYYSNGTWQVFLAAAFISLPKRSESRGINDHKAHYRIGGCISACFFKQN